MLQLHPLMACFPGQPA